MCKISEPSGSAKLIARAEQLLRDQDIGGARLLLERAAKDDNLRAVFLLAETYDPRVLADLKIIGVSGDRTKARELYSTCSQPHPGGACARSPNGVGTGPGAALCENRDASGQEPRFAHIH